MPLIIETPHANGREAWWWNRAADLQTLLPSEALVTVSVGEATDWHEPGTERHGLPFWFLVVRVTPASAWPAVWERLESLGLGPCYGESEDDVECGNPAAGELMVADVLVGLSQKQVRLRLAKAGREVS